MAPKSRVKVKVTSIHLEKARFRFFLVLLYMLTDAQTYCTGNQQIKMGEKRAMKTAKTGEK